jgi:predicted dehydrogenase
MSGGFDPRQLRQAWPLPEAPRPIVIFGAGGIVGDAHLPAYRKAGFPVAGIYDIDAHRAAALAERWALPRVFGSAEEAAAEPGAVFDLATPPAAHAGLLALLPPGSTVLMQKPMGRNLAEASEILHLCRARRLTAAVNFQLRFAPMTLAVRDALERGLLGRLVDVEVHLNLLTPWHLFPFLKTLERVEIAVHSIHYLDLIRSLLGNPLGVHAKTVGHPGSELAQTRTAAILDYGERVRCCLSINHDHDFGRRFQDASFRFEGDRGAALVKLGLLLDYPRGEPDELWLAGERQGAGQGAWQSVPLAGAWFPDAFVGRMANLQRVASGEDGVLEASVEDAWQTMALVEACFRSSAAPATPLATLPPA